MRKVALALLAMLVLVGIAQDYSGWFYDDTSGMYVTTDGYYYYFYAPYYDLYYAYEPATDIYYYYDAASGMFYPYGTSSTSYAGYDDYTGSGYASGGEMDQSTYNTMMNVLNDEHAASMNAIEAIDGNVDYYYYTDDYYGYGY